jgi:hypothetical protein
MTTSVTAELSFSPVAVTVTPAVRLAYVLQHFQRAYEQVPLVAVGYPSDETSITVVDGAGHFFSETAPYPAAPNWREWQGRRVPFFFDRDSERELLTLTPGKACINADVVAAAFYLLSGWQEYFSAARDRHGRFPYAASVQKQYGFVALPVVNYYFDVLKTAIEHATGVALRPRRWNGTAPFAAFISHDIDNLHGGWGTAARYLLRRVRLRGFVKLIASKAAGQPAPWNNLEHVQQATTQLGAPSTFFILAATAPRPMARPTPITPPTPRRFGRDWGSWLPKAPKLPATAATAPPMMWRSCGRRFAGWSRRRSATASTTSAGSPPARPTRWLRPGSPTIRRWALPSILASAIPTACPFSRLTSPAGRRTHSSKSPST